MLIMLNRDYFNKASESIMKYGRPLEKTLFERYFRGGSAENILIELKKFHNKDGGFGHGIESDFRLPYSSPMATSVGIRLSSQIDEIIEAKEMIKAAIRYLEIAFDRERNGWFAVSEEINKFPHAPWWHYDKEKGMTIIDRNWGNPTAEILAYIYKYREYVKKLDVNRLVEYAVHYIENKEKFDSENELFCYIKLYEVLPKELQKRLEKRIAFAIEQVIIYDEKKWHEYIPRPVDFVKGLDSNRFGILESKIYDNLEFIIRQLELDGKINPPWGKSFYNEDLKDAYDEWIGVLTFKDLTILDIFKKISV